MIATIKTKNGICKIDTEAGLNKNTPYYTALCNFFDEWINDYASSDAKAMYTEPCEEFEGRTYCSMLGAIRDMHEAVCEYIEEKKISILTTKDFWEIDLEGVIQP